MLVALKSCTHHVSRHLEARSAQRGLEIGQQGRSRLGHMAFRHCTVFPSTEAALFDVARALKADRRLRHNFLIIACATSVCMRLTHSQSRHKKTSE